MAWGGVPPVWLLLRHTVCAPVPGCVWVHLLRASLSALPALLCLSRILLSSPPLSRAPSLNSVQPTAIHGLMLEKFADFE